jgi:ubiquitin-protein ligase
MVRVSSPKWVPNSRYTTQNSRVIQGRILPQSEPYFQTSLLVRIILPPEYPFKVPDIFIIDSIYHPNVSELGEHCCCWGFSSITGFRPTISLAEIINTVVHVIDHPDCTHSINAECSQEYQNDYKTFYQKALKVTLLHRRPRYWSNRLTRLRKLWSYIETSVFVFLKLFKKIIFIEKKTVRK